MNSAYTANSHSPALTAITTKTTITAIIVRIIGAIGAGPLFLGFLLSLFITFVLLSRAKVMILFYKSLSSYRAFVSFTSRSSAIIGMFCPTFSGLKPYI